MIESSLSPSEPVLIPDRSFGLVTRSVLGYSLVTALMIVAPLPVFVPAVLFHCAMRNSRRAAWAVGAISLALAAAFFATVSAQAPDSRHLAWSGLAGVALAIVLPSLMAIPLVERGEAFGRVLAFLLCGSAFGLAATEIGSRTLLSFSPYALQVEQARVTNARMLDLSRAGAEPKDMAFIERMADYNLIVLPGSLLVVIGLFFILSLMMIGRLPVWREWVARRGDPAFLGAYHFRNLSLPDWVLFAFILGGLTPLASGMLQKVAANTLVVVAFLYILQGLAIFRFVLVSMGVGFGGTMFGWALLLFLILAGRGAGLLILGVAGLLDPFYDFRNYKKRKDDSHESHSD